MSDPIRPTLTIAESPYPGPFPRKRHSHRCTGCRAWGQTNAVACYKSHCTRPQLVHRCPSCK
jgi:hypothetical protein